MIVNNITRCKTDFNEDELVLITTIEFSKKPFQTNQ